MYAATNTMRISNCFVTALAKRSLIFLAILVSLATILFAIQSLKSVCLENVQDAPTTLIHLRAVRHKRILSLGMNGNGLKLQLQYSTVTVPMQKDIEKIFKSIK